MSHVPRLSNMPRGGDRKSGGARRTGNVRRFGSSLKSSIGDPLITQKKIVRNQKYDYVKSSVRTGNNTNNTRVKMDRRGEIFKRLKRSTLAGFLDAGMVSTHKTQILNNAEEDDPLNSSMDSETQSEMSFMTMTSTQSTVFGDFTEVLLVDVRDQDVFNQYHISNSINFPLAQLRRDGFTGEMYEFKNKQDRIIVVYGEDESKTWSTAAGLMVQKHFDNIYYLTGGLKYFVEKFPHYVVPAVPQQYKPKRKPSKGKGGLSSPSSLSSSMRSLHLMNNRSSHNNNGRLSPRQQLMRQQHRT